MKKKTYKITFTKTGKEWKSFNSGLDMLEDNKKYRMEWEITGLRNAIEAWWSIFRKRPGEYIAKTES